MKYSYYTSGLSLVFPLCSRQFRRPGNASFHPSVQLGEQHFKRETRLKSYVVYCDIDENNRSKITDTLDFPLFKQTNTGNSVIIHDVLIVSIATTKYLQDMASLSTLEVARSDNSLLSLSLFCEDQVALLGFIEDYFTSPDGLSDTEDSESDTETGNFHVPRRKIGGKEGH